MKTLLTLLSGLFFTTLIAGNHELCTVSGRISDKDKKPLEFVVVTLLKAQDSVLVKGAISAADGSYILENIMPGDYLLTASFTGYEKNRFGPFTIADGQAFSVPEITLLSSVTMNEATITAIRPLYIRKPDMLIMDVENSPVRIIGTAWDLVGTVPGVTTDQNGSITMRGKSGVKVYVDGKNTYLGGEQLMTYLQNISAADVVRIEIITNPSARYDAEGSAGIINIITRKGSQLGFNANIRAGYGVGVYSKYDGGVDANYAQEKFNVYGRYFFSNNNHLIRSYINRNVPYNGNTTNFDQNTSIKSTPFAHRASVGLDLYAKHDITWGFRVDGSLFDEDNHTINKTMITMFGNDTTNQLYQLNDQHQSYRTFGTNIYYRQKLDTNGRELSGGFDYLTYNIGSKDTFNLEYTSNYSLTPYYSELQRSGSATGISIYVGQIDYTQPFGKKFKLEIGAKSSYVETKNDLGFYVWNGSLWNNDTTRSNSFIYKEQINAGYATGYVDLGKWQVMAGVRAEHTIADGQSPTTGEGFNRKYLNFFPSVFILYQLNKSNAINFSYSRRINRPAYDALNPFVFYLDKYTFEKGNPLLQPEIAHNLELSYSFMDAVFVTTGVGRTLHSMTDVTNQVDSTAVGYKTTVNLDHTDNAYFGLGSPVPIGRWFMGEIEFGASYGRFVSDLYGTPIDIKAWMWNASTNMTFMLPKDFKVQAWGWYNSPAVYGIFYTKPQGGVGFGISKTFFNRQLTINASAMDVFHTSGMRANINFQNQDMYVEFIPETPRVYVRVRYSFGNRKATRKAETKSGADELKNRTGK
jgi:iron complex outermembrane recepter protein